MNNGGTKRLPHEGTTIKGEFLLYYMGKVVTKEWDAEQGVFVTRQKERRTKGAAIEWTKEQLRMADATGDAEVIRVYKTNEPGTQFQLVAIAGNGIIKYDADEIATDLIRLA